MTTQWWPAWMAPNRIEWWLETPSRSGGVSILGNERIVASPSARWRCNMSFRIWGTPTDPSRLLTFRAIMGGLYGRSGLLLIGPFDRVTPEFLAGATAHDVTTTFSDASFLNGGAPVSQVTGIGAVAIAAARGARSITVSYSGRGRPQAGQYFGLGGGALYLADTSTENGDGTLTLTFSPGLRAAAAVDAPVDFEHPRATMRLTADDGGRAPLVIGGVADLTLDLVEAY